MTTINISDTAKIKISALAAEKNLTKFFFRIGLRAGGCMGLSQYFDFCTAPSSGDLELESNGVRVVMDKKSALFLDGMVLDWVDNLMEKRFSVTFPQKAKSCSCGTSFSV
jgi:iron-sulfur cluster assembly protein